MSVFTNRAGRSAELAEAYVQALLELLGDEDPREILAGTPASLRERVQDRDVDMLSRPEAAGKWSARQVIRHMADSEIVWAYRLRLVLGQHRPALTGYDQDAWAENLGYEHADIDDSLEEFRVLRRANLRLLAACSDQDLERVGLHAERGEESVAEMIRLYAAHDLLHLRQIERILRAVD